MTGTGLILTIASGCTAGFVLICSVVRIARDRRRPSNGFWLASSLFLAWLTAVVAGFAAGSDDTQLLTAVVLIPLVFLLLALIGVSIGLVLNTPVVVRREGLRIATLVPLAIASTIAGTLMVSAWWIYVVAIVQDPVRLWTTLLVPVLAVPGVIVIFELVAFAGYALLYSRLDDPRHVAERADVVVVLGAGLDGQRVTPLLAARLDRGIEVFWAARAAGRAPRLVVSGGKGSDEVIAEADAMGDYAIDHGVPAEYVVRERRSTTTAENLAFTVGELVAAKITWHRMVIVTSNFHVLRSASLARRLGMDAAAIGARTALYYVPTAFLREFAAMVVYYRRGTAVACSLAIGSWMLLVAVGFLLTR